jgi:hypothetical protein
VNSGSGRFALRLAMSDDMQHPLEQLLEMGNALWSTYGGVETRVKLSDESEYVRVYAALGKGKSTSVLRVCIAVQSLGLSCITSSTS